MRSARGTCELKPQRRLKQCLRNVSSGLGIHLERSRRRNRMNPVRHGVRDTKRHRDLDIVTRNVSGLSADEDDAPGLVHALDRAPDVGRWTLLNAGLEKNWRDAVRGCSRGRRGNKTNKRKRALRIRHEERPLTKIRIPRDSARC